MNSVIFKALMLDGALTPDELERVHEYMAGCEDCIAELRADAERYRWLRGEVEGPHVPLAQVVWKLNGIRDSGDWTNLADGATLDEEIDAALRQRAEQDQQDWME